MRIRRGPLYLGILCGLLSHAVHAQTPLITCRNNPDLSQRYEVETANVIDNGITKVQLQIRDIANDGGPPILSQTILPSSGTQGSFTILESQSIKLKTNRRTQRCELEFVMSGLLSTATTKITQIQMLLDSGI